MERDRPTRARLPIWPFLGTRVMCDRIDHPVEIPDFGPERFWVLSAARCLSWSGSRRRTGSRLHLSVSLGSDIAGASGRVTMVQVDQDIVPEPSIVKATQVTAVAQQRARAHRHYHHSAHGRVTRCPRVLSGTHGCVWSPDSSSGPPTSSALHHPAHPVTERIARLRARNHRGGEPIPMCNVATTSGVRVLHRTGPHAGNVRGCRQTGAWWTDHPDGISPG